MNDVSEPPKTVIQVPQNQNESPPRIYKENNTDANQPETPTPPSTGGTNDTRAPEPVPLSERHQAALRHIHSLESHNTKLYQDNCRLVNAVNMLNDRLAFLGASQNAQMYRLTDMQEKLHASEANRAVISQKYQELIQCVSGGSAHHHISLELQAIRDAYTSLEREHRFLGDKYIRLKAVVDTNRIVPARGLTPVVRSEFANGAQFRVNDQNRNNPPSPASVMSSDSCRILLDQSGHHVRRNSENFIVQPSLRPGTAPIATTWSAPLPTPPPSASLAGGQNYPTGLPVHAPMSVGSIPLPRHDLRTSSAMSAVTPSKLPLQQGTSEQLRAAAHLHRRYSEFMDTTINQPTLCSKQISSAPWPLSPRPPKRPSMELQPSTSPGGEYKRARIEGEIVHPPTINADACPATKIPSPPAPIDPSNDPKLSVSTSDVRSYQDCVDLIFEKDADVENGVFCGLCFNRYEEKMIQEPPDVLVKPELDFLVAHCMSMHPAVWDDLRRNA